MAATSEMDPRVKQIYLAMIKPLRHWPSSIPVWREWLEESKIKTTEIFDDRRGKISGAWWQDFKSSDGVWQNWAHGYIKEINRVIKEFKKIKVSVVVTDEIIVAAKILEPLFTRTCEYPKNIVPFRDRIHTKGVFRRAKITNDKDGDGSSD